jgi:hypothetical protein
MTWVPDACTLPTVEQPLRQAEFDGLFARALSGLERKDPLWLRLELDGSAQVEEVTRDLVARESGCCSFFDFALAREGDRLVVDVQVPASQQVVLDALEARAAATGRVGP